MARIRTIKPEFPQSESMGRVSRDARLLFIMLWTICDDVGRARAAPRMLASLLYPYDDDAKTHIVQWLFELERQSCIKLYEVDGNAYLQIEKWQSHQKIDRPSGSRFPDPSMDNRDRSAKPREPSSEDLVPRKGPSTLDLGPLTEETPAAPPAVGLAVVKDFKLESEIPPFLLRPKPEKPKRFEVPSWVPDGPWTAWVQMRKQTKTPLTDHGMKLAIAELEKLKAQGHEPSAVLDQSTLKNWRGLFALPAGVTSQAPAAVPPSNLEAAQRAEEEFVRKKREQANVH